MNLKAKKLIYNILFCTVFINCLSLQAGHTKKQVDNKKEKNCKCLNKRMKKTTYNYHRYPCRLPECKAGFDDYLIRFLHESDCIANYQQEIQRLYLEPDDLGISVMYKSYQRQQAHIYMRENHPLKQEPVKFEIEELDNLHSEEY